MVGTAEADGTEPLEDESTQVAVIPLMSERALGVVSLRLGRAKPYSADERELLVAAADITSSSMARAMLHTRLEAVARRNASLSQVLHAMEAETSVRERAQRMADLLVPEHGEMAIVDLDEIAPDLAGLRHVDASKEATVRWLHERLRRSDATAPRAPVVKDDRSPATEADVSDAALEAAGLDPDEPAAVHALIMDSFVRIPLVARGRKIGTLTLASSVPGREPDTEEFHGRLADACALSLDNARLYEHERDIAQQLQAALLPESLPTDRRFSLHHFYQAGRDAVQVPPVLVAPESEPGLLAEGRGVLLGLLGDGEPDVARAMVPPGSAIVMYTDGLIERPSRSIDDSIGELLRVLGDDPDLAIKPDVLARKCDSDERSDDTCVLTLRLTESSTPEGEGRAG